MIRLVLTAFAVAAVAWLALRIWKDAQSADIDWRGVAFAGGFVALAVYLNHATGIGGL